MKIFIFTGPHGAGRRTVAEMAGSTLGIKHILTYTSRPPHSWETNGDQYHFISNQAFDEAEANQEFIEVSLVNNNRYGVKRADLESTLGRGKHVYLILNRDGAEVLRQRYGEQVIRIFIYCDAAVLEERSRATNHSNAEIARYMSYYDEEMAYKVKCEHSFENIDLAHTMFDLTKTLESYMGRNLLELD
jgi:guanylate kinase